MTDQNQPVLNTPRPSQPGPPPGPPAPPPAPAKRLGFLLMAAIAVVLVILAVATTGLVLAKTPGSGLSYGGDTPQAVVQAWAQAIQAQEYATADSYLSENALANGESPQMMLFGNWKEFSIGGTSIQGDRASIDATIAIEVSSTSVPGLSTMTMSVTFDLVRENGAWKIDGLGLGQPSQLQSPGD